MKRATSHVTSNGITLFSRCPEGTLLAAPEKSVPSGQPLKGAAIVIGWIFFLVTSPHVRAQTPPTEVDWLLNQAKSTTAPALTTQTAASPFRDDEPGSRHGTITTSDGKTLTGSISTTAEKPLRVWVEADKEYHDIPFETVKSIEAQVLWERDEKEWHFVTGGSDVKEYSGKTYPARETQYKLTLTDGSTVEGGIVAPLNVTTADGSKNFVLHKRDKGEVGKKLGDLVYVKSVTF